MQLKEKIARIVFDARGSTEWAPEIGDKCGAAADAILAIPAIRDALDAQEREAGTLGWGWGEEGSLTPPVDDLG